MFYSGESRPHAQEEPDDLLLFTPPHAARRRVVGGAADCVCRMPAAHRRGRRGGAVGGDDCRCRLSAPETRQAGQRLRSRVGPRVRRGAIRGDRRNPHARLRSGPQEIPILRRGRIIGTRIWFGGRRARVDVVTLVTLRTVFGGPPAAARRPLPRGPRSRRRCNTVQYACNTARPMPLGPAPGPLLPRRLSPNYGAAPAAPLFCLIRAGGTPPPHWSRRDRARMRRNKRGGNARGCPGRRDRCRPPPAPRRGTRRPARGCRR